jgi:glycosyltransferase involved in cell wall biosynthesis
MAGRKRITVVADELLGYVRTGGIGTATTYLAVALGRMSHDVEILYVGEPPSAPMADKWSQLYEDAGVAVRHLARSDTPIEPSYFARMHDVELALATDPPEVVITQDLAAPAYTAIRMRALGLGFDETLFVVYCHGTRQWITDAARKVRVLPGALGITMLEQASIELADVVVSPSRYLVDWMQQQRWRLPADSRVIPHLTRSVATGEPQLRAEHCADGVRRIAYFGRLEERKGIGSFIEGLNALPTQLLDAVDVDFIGRATPAWTPKRVRALLPENVRASFETNLDQPDALASLTRPGTLAVMPSFEETFGNTVRECLDWGIPFIASTAAAIQELVAPEDRTRVLFEPTPRGIETALRRALTDADALRPARAAFDNAASLPAWANVVETWPPRAPAELDLPAADVLRQREVAETSAPFVLFLADEDEPDPDLLHTLQRAQSASGADVVSCGLRTRGEGGETLHFFHGDPGGLGLLLNGYGTVALIRRSLLGNLQTPWPVEDPDWPLLADLSLSGARIVSVPAPLVTRSAGPGSIGRDPSAALLVVQRFERALPETLRSLARLAAGLAAATEVPNQKRPQRGRVSLRRLVRRTA